MCASAARGLSLTPNGSSGSIEGNGNKADDLEVGMPESYVVTGTLTDECTVSLDEKLPLGSTKLKLTIEPISSLDSATPIANEESIQKPPYMEFMAELRRRQDERGHQPRSKEEIDADLQSERDSWDE